MGYKPATGNPDLPQLQVKALEAPAKTSFTIEIRFANPLSDAQCLVRPLAQGRFARRKSQRFSLELAYELFQLAGQGQTIRASLVAFTIHCFGAPLCASLHCQYYLGQARSRTEVFLSESSLAQLLA